MNTYLWFAILAGAFFYAHFHGFRVGRKLGHAEAITEISEKAKSLTDQIISDLKDK